MQSTALCVSAIFHAHRHCCTDRHGWFPPKAPLAPANAPDIQPVLKAIQAGVRREVAMKRTAEVLVWLVLLPLAAD